MEPNKSHRIDPVVELMIIGFFILAVWCLVLCLSGCTATTVEVQPKKASWDAGQQNSGLIDTLTNAQGQATACIVTPHWRERYNGLITLYGSRFVAPLHPDDGLTPTPSNAFIVDAQHYADFCRMNLWSQYSTNALHP